MAVVPKVVPRKAVKVIREQVRKRHKPVASRETLAHHERQVNIKYLANDRYRDRRCV